MEMSKCCMRPPKFNKSVHIREWRNLHASVLFLVAILGTVIYLAVTKRDMTKTEVAA